MIEVKIIRAKVQKNDYELKNKVVDWLKAKAPDVKIDMGFRDDGMGDVVPLFREVTFKFQDPNQAMLFKLTFG